MAVSGPGKPFIAIGPNANLNHNVGDRAATDEGECSETACGTSGAANNSFEEVGCNEKDRSKSPTGTALEYCTYWDFGLGIGPVMNTRLQARTRVCAHIRTYTRTHTRTNILT